MFCLPESLPGGDLANSTRPYAPGNTLCKIVRGCCRAGQERQVLQLARLWFRECPFDLYQRMWAGEGASMHCHVRSSCAGCLSIKQPGQNAYMLSISMLAQPWRLQPEKQCTHALHFGRYRRIVEGFRRSPIRLHSSEACTQHTARRADESC